jgi:hypothetical protein
MIRFGLQWSAVVGSGRQWSAVVGSGRQWSAVVGDDRKVDFISGFAISSLNPCPHHRAFRRAAVSATFEPLVAALTKSDDSVRL